ncbi:MAG: alpha/beta hydrolase, partial [Gammaproteobacteria bacterium]|nr:alpha/beta hydrolase [Gammaproteobacteria bacterium]
EMLAAPKAVQTQSVTANGVPAEWVQGPASEPPTDGVTLYLHGGGYVIGSIATHRNLAYNLSRASGTRVLVIDYRLAPEHPFPAPVEDAVNAYRWLLDQGIAPAKITIAGDSAGGGLAVATLVALKEQGIDAPSCAICISPWVDMEAIGASMDTKAELDPMVQKQGILRMAGMYLGSADPRSPLAAPIYADLHDLPPMLIQVGTAETLLDDSTRLAEHARAHGVDVTLEISDDMVHVWHLFAPMLSEGRDAIDRAGAYMKKHLAS